MTFLNENVNVIKIKFMNDKVYMYIKNCPNVQVQVYLNCPWECSLSKTFFHI